MAGNLDRSVVSESASDRCDRPAKVARTGVFDGDDGVDQRDIGELETMSQKNPGVQRYLVAIEYVWIRFLGSQQQLNCRTVVGVLEDAFKKFIKQLVLIFCSSRTLSPHEPIVVKRAVNHFLQKNEGNVMITNVRCVAPDFRARYKALERT